MEFFSGFAKVPRPRLTQSLSLPRNQVPEWASAYINYKGLKKLIKAAAQASKDGEEADLAGDYSHAWIDFCHVYENLSRAS